MAHVVTSAGAAISASRSPSVTFSGYTPLENDVVVMWTTSTGTGVTVADITGWTNVLGSATDVESDSHQIAAGYHLVTSAEQSAVTTTYTMTNWTSVAQTGEVIGVVVRGVDPASVVDDKNSTFNSTNTVTPHVLASLTGANLSTGSIALSCVAKDATGTYTTPTDWVATTTRNTNQGVAAYYRRFHTVSGTNIAAVNITPSAGDEYASISLALTAAQSGNAVASANTTSFNYTTASGDTILIVGVSVASGGNQYSTYTTRTCTFNGVSMTSVSATPTNPSSFSGFVEMFYLANPPIGTYSVAVTEAKTGNTNGSTIAGAASFAGPTQIGTPVTANSSSSTTPSVTVTSSADETVVAFLGSGDPMWSPTDTVKFHMNFNNNTSAGNCLLMSQVGEASSVLSGTMAGTSAFGAIGVGLITPPVLTPASATLTLTGQTPTVTLSNNQLLSPASATLTLTGQTPTITATTQDVEPDATGAGDTENATSTSWSHTLGASATGIIVGVTCSLSSTTTSGWAKSVTCGGVAMTLLGSQSINNSTSSSQVDLWALTSPPTGAQTIAVSYTLAANVPYLTGNSVSYNNVGSFGTAVLHWGNSNTLSSSAVSSATGRRVVSAFSAWYNLGNISISAPSGSSRYSLNGTSNTYAPTLIEDAPGAATVTNTATLSGTPFWGAVSVDILKPAGTTLTPAGATLALAGQTPTVSVSNNFTVSPASASLALTGQTPTVTTTNHLVVSPAGEFLTLETYHVPTITVSDHKVVSPAGATLTLTGATPVVTATAHITLTPASATLTLTGQTPTVTSSDHKIAAPAGASLALTGGTPVVTASDHKVVSPAGASLTLTGSTPVVTVADHRTVVPAGASLTLTGGTPVVTATANHSLAPASATLTLTGQTPTVTATAHKVVSPASATLALTGQTPTVAVTAHKTVTPAGATLALTGSTPTVTASSHQVIQPASAWLTLDVYHAPTIIVTHHLTVSPASAQFTLTGSVPVVLNPVYIMPQSAVLTLTGETPLVIWSAPVLPPEERRVLASVDSRLVVAAVSDRMEIATLSDREE